MADNKTNPISIPVTLDIGELSKREKDVRSSITALRDEFKLLSAGTKEQRDSYETLLAKEQNLIKQADEHTKKIELIREQYELSKKELGETAHMTETLAMRLGDAERAAAKVNAQLSDAQTSAYAKGLKELEREARATSDSFELMEAAAQANDDELALADIQLKRYEASLATLDKQQAYHSEQLGRMAAQYGESSVQYREVANAAERTRQKIAQLTAEHEAEGRAVDDAATRAAEYENSLKRLRTEQAMIVSQTNTAVQSLDAEKDAQKILALEVTGASDKLKKQQEIVAVLADQLNAATQATDKNEQQVRELALELQKAQEQEAVFQQGVKKTTAALAEAQTTPYAKSLKELEREARASSESLDLMEAAARANKDEIALADVQLKRYETTLSIMGRQQTIHGEQLHRIAAQYGEQSVQYREVANAAEKTRQEVVKLTTEREAEIRAMDEGTKSAAYYEEALRRLTVEQAMIISQTSTAVQSLDAEKDAQKILALEVTGASDKLKKQQEIVAVLADRLNTAAQATDANEQQVRELALELQKAQEQEAAFQQELHRTTDALQAQGMRIEELGDMITQNLTQPLVQYGKAALDAGLANEAMEATFDVTFGKAADKMRTWSENMANAMHVSEYAARDMMSQFTVMFKGMDVGANDTERMMKNLTVAAYDMAAFFDIEVSEAFGKLQSGLVGSSKPLQELGIIIRETEVNAYALSRGIVKTTSDLTEQQKVMIRYELIMKKTAQANDTWNRELETGSGRIKALNESADELKIRVGDALLPLLEKVLNVVQPLVEMLANAPDGVLSVAVTVGTLAAALGPLIKLFQMIKGLSIVQSITSAIGVSAALSTSMTFVTGALQQMWPILLIVVGLILLLKWAMSSAGSAAKGMSNELDAGLRKTEQTTAQLQKTASSVPKHASGTGYSRGGRAIVGENGPELIELPEGSRVRTAPQTAAMGAAGGGDTYNFYIDFDQVSDVVKFMDTVKHAKRINRQK